MTQFINCLLLFLVEKIKLDWRKVILTIAWRIFSPIDLPCRIEETLHYFRFLKRNYLFFSFTFNFIVFILLKRWQCLLWSHWHFKYLLLIIFIDFVEVPIFKFHVDFHINVTVNRVIMGIASSKYWLYYWYLFSITGFFYITCIL